MQLGEYIKSATDRLSGIYPAEEAKAIAVRVAASVLSVPDYKYLSEPELSISQEKAQLLEEMTQQLAEYRPVQYVLGYTEFAGLKIKVKEGVLIPRPETEQLYALAADTLEDICNADPSKSVTVLDMCTGSGCLAYAFASDFPQAQVYGCDKSTEALNIACKQRLKCIKPIFFYADVLDVPPAGLPQFDIIVSNPPYVKESEREFMRENVLKYEPEQALFVPNENPLLFYRAIADWCKLLLKPGGHLFLEINEALGEETAALYENSEIFVDFNDKPRFIHYRA